MKLTKMFALTLMLATIACQASTEISNPIDNQQIYNIVNDGLNYLAKTQVKESKDFKQFKGEWPSYMTNLTNFILLGKGGKKSLDSNNFSTATIHNLLAKIYLQNPQLENIPSMLQMAIDNITSYQSNETFNFWPLIPNKKKKHNGKQEELVHGPTNYLLKSKFINNAANVANDSDDTAQAYQAILLNKKVAQQSGLIDGPNWSRENIGTIFARYRDKKRHKAHFYNLIGNKVGAGTGAFLTWMSEEKKFLALRNIIPGNKGNYIPYGVNDVDAVVNTNILSALSLYNELYTTDGVSDACALVNRAFKKENSREYDVYYPNSFTLHYTTANAINLGAKCLEESLGQIIRTLKEQQQNDGSWKQDWVDDVFQSTAYALAALIDSNDNSSMTHEMIIKAINFLIDNRNHDERGTYWNGGIFFSGGTVVRQNIVWKSDAVTTAYIIYALEKYRLRQLDLSDGKKPFYQSASTINYDPFLGYFYQQKNYSLFDLQGDIALARSLKVFLHNGVKMLLKDTEHGENDIKIKEELEVKYKPLYGKPEINPILTDRIDYTWTEEKINKLDISQEAKDLMLKKAVGTTFSIDSYNSKPFKVENITDLFFQIIYEEYTQNGIIPTPGNIHQWHPDFLKNHGNDRAWAMKPFSKVMHALFKGVTSKFLVTGSEVQLTNFILSHPYDSVTLEQVFRKSYQLNNGDLYLTILTIENIFSEHWDKPQRANRAVTRRLTDIHHHFNRGDKYGAWYHLFGMMLYGYIESGFQAKIVGNVEAFGAGLFTRFAPDAQENYINRKGGNIGNRLHKLVKKFNKIQKWPTDYFSPDSIYLSTDYYLEKSPNWSKAIITKLK